MKIKATAIRTAGLGCIKGDTETFSAKRIEDDGDCLVAVRSENWLVYFNKENWKLEVLKER